MAQFWLMSTTSQHASCPALPEIGAKCHEYRGMESISLILWRLGEEGRRRVTMTAIKGGINSINRTGSRGTELYTKYMVLEDDLIVGGGNLMQYTDHVP